MPDRQQLTENAGLAERVFVWTELALSGLLRSVARMRRDGLHVLR